MASESQAVSGAVNGNAATIFAGSNGSSANPRAYLNYILFDRDFNYEDAGYVQVGGQSSTPQAISQQINIQKTGYIYVYVSNESNTNFDVFFDDLRVIHTKGKILQEDHYYPFGANISALSSSAPLTSPNRYKYNGNEEQSDFDLGLYDFNARFYDKQLGRFTSVDPLADEATQESFTPYHYSINNPVLFSDPSGACVLGLPCPKWAQETGDFIVGVVEGFAGHKRGEPVGNQGYTLDTFRQHDDSEGETKNEAHGNGRKTGKVLFEIVDLVFNPGSKGKKLLGLGKEIAESLGENAGKKVVKEGLEEIIEHSADDLVTSAARLAKGKTSRGVQALSKKIGRGDEAFKGLKATQENADNIIRDVMGSKGRVMQTTRNQQGVEVIDYFNPKSGQGIRVIKESGAFDTFINYAK